MANLGRPKDRILGFEADKEGTDLLEMPPRMSFADVVRFGKTDISVVVKDGNPASLGEEVYVQAPRGGRVALISASG